MDPPKEQYEGVLKESTLTINVEAPQVELETLTNKRIITNGNKIISDLMADPTKDGITKQSNIIIDIPTPDITQITNYQITQNGSQTIPIPTGYDAVDSINVNVNVNPYPTIINFFGNNPLIKFGTRDFELVTQNTQVNIYHYLMVAVYEYEEHYYIYTYNGFTNNINVGLTISSSYTLRYYKLEMNASNQNRVYLYNYDLLLFTLVDNISTDGNPSILQLPKTVFQINWN